MHRRGRGTVRASAEAGGRKEAHAGRHAPKYQCTVPFKMSTAVTHAMLMSVRVSRRSASAAVSCAAFSRPSSPSIMLSPSTAVFMGVRSSWLMYLCSQGTGQGGAGGGGRVRSVVYSKGWRPTAG